MYERVASRQEQMAVAAPPWGEVSVCYADDSDGNSFDRVLLGLGAANSAWLTSADELRRLKARGVPAAGSAARA